MNMRSGWWIASALCLLSGCGAEKDEGAVGETASDRIELTAEAPEPIVHIAVTEGATVRAGDVLLRQDPARAEAAVGVAAAELAKARALLAERLRGPRSERLDAARANVTGAREQVAFRVAEYERIRRIFERDLATAELRDRAKAELDAARSGLDLFEAQLEELLAGTTVEELDQAEAEVAAAQARLDSAELSLERLTLRAPVAGIADSRLFELGERPAAGQPVMILLGGEQAYARVFVSEELRAHVRSGTSVRVHVDGFTTGFDGRVRWVASEAAFTPFYALTERDRGRLTYMAKVDILGAGERLPDGIPVQVRFPAGPSDE